MIKLIALAAVTTLAFAAPASASEIRIPVAGKTVAQLNTEIDAAARTVCKQDNAGLSVSAYDACYKSSLQAAKAQLQQFAAAEGKQYAAN